MDSPGSLRSLSSVSSRSSQPFRVTAAGDGTDGERGRRPPGPAAPGSSANAVSVTSSPSQIRPVPASPPNANRSPSPSPTAGPGVHGAPSSSSMKSRASSIDGGVAVGRLERVERVALNERAVERGERLDLADVVEHDEATADRSEHPDLAAVHLDGPRDCVELFAAALEHVVHRARAGVDAVATGRVGHLPPDLALNRARLQAGGEARARLRVLHPAQPRVGRLRRRGERLVVTRSVPAARLDAADRHLQHGARPRRAPTTSKVRFCWAPSTSSPS